MSTSGPAPRPLQRPMLIATRLFAPEPSPAAFRNEALAMAMERAGHEVRVVTTKAPVPPGYRDRIRNVSRWPVKRDRQGHVRGYLSYLSFDIPLFFRLLFTPRPACVVSEPPPTTGLATLAACAVRRIPYFFYAADIWADAAETVPGVPRFVLKAVRMSEMLVWKRATGILAISPGIEHRIIELIGPHRGLAMVGNGINVADFDSFGPASDDSAPTFLYTGTVSEWHGAGIFLDAYAQLIDEYPDLRLHFYSEGAEREALQRRAHELGLYGVSFFHRVPPQDMARHLRSAVAALSSVAPGLGYDFAIPTKIYAATACGTPVIHTGRGAAIELVDNGAIGWAVDYSVDAVAEAMRAALTARERPTREHLRSWTVERASLSAAGDQAVDAIHRALEGHSRA